jgi:DnaJ family protein C protein 3
MRNYQFLYALVILGGGNGGGRWAASAASSSSGTSNHPIDDTDWSAGKLRSAADEALLAGDYGTAVEYLHRAIQAEPDIPLNHYKLYRVYHRQRQFDNALAQITQASALDANAYQSTKARLLLNLGQCDRAVLEYEAIFQSNPDHFEKQQADFQKAKDCWDTLQSANQAFIDRDFRTAADLYHVLLGYIENSIDLVWPKAVSLYEIGDFYGVISETGKILKQQPQNIDAYRLRGDAYRYLGEHDQAILHYREGLKLDPEHKECKKSHKAIKALEKKKKKGQDAFDKGDFQGAVEVWLAALSMEPTHDAFNRPLQLQLAKAYSRLGQHNNAISTIQNQIEENETLEALWALGEAQQAADQYEEAVRTFNRALEIATDDMKQEAKQKLQQANVALKQSKEKNYYKILGLSRNSDKKEIKKAYRELALKWHPDKNEDKEKAEKMFQDISEAYEVLSDEELKAKYDRGEPVFDNQGGGGAHPHNPFQFFNQNFHFQQGGGGGPRVHFRYG